MEMEETGDADNLTLLVTNNDTFRVNDTCPYSDSAAGCLNDTWISDTNDTCVTADNVTDVCLSDGEESDYLYKTEQLVFICLLLTVIVSGNSLVLITQLSPRTRRSRMNFFIMHLALADLSVGLLSVSTDIVWKVTMTWEAGLLACKLIRFLQVVVTYASTYVLVALSIDRYDAITHPMAFTGSWRRAKWLVASAWFLSILFSVPIIFLYNIAVPETAPELGVQCWISFPEQWHWKLYMTLVSTSLFFIPAVIIATCYAVIVATIWRKGQTMVTPKVTQSLLPRVPLTEARRRKIALDSNDDCRRASSRGLIPKAKVKTIKMTFVIVFVFILCWSPYIIFDMLQVYELLPNNETVGTVATFIQSLAPLNSAANPLIYFMFSANFNKYFRNSRLRRWLCCCLGPADQAGYSAANTSTSTNLRTTSTLASSSVSSSGAYTKTHRDSLLPDKVSTVRFSTATIAAQRY